MIAPSAGGDNPQLKMAIISEIQAAPRKRITFERFMEMALYQSGLGYYTHQAGLIGARGDFYTSPHLSPVFGELIAAQILDFWQHLGRPDRFQVVEVGAGQGLMASDILSWLYRYQPELWSALCYTIVEISAELRLAQHRRLEVVPDGPALLEKTEWRTLDEFSRGEVTGCFISNELLDSFPVHLLVVRAGEWHEVYVTYDSTDQEFKEEEGELSSPALAAYFERLGLDLARYEEGYRAEVNLQAQGWIEKVAAALGRGYVLTIDYGYPAEQRYHPLRRTGTLQCYSGHAVHDDPYRQVGRQDITTHVDFTSLMRWGEESGLRVEGFTRQANFLAGLGIGERLAAVTAPDYRERAGLTTKQWLAERDALQRLINPAALGNFWVLVQAKGLSEGSEKLAGLKLAF